MSQQTTGTHTHGSAKAGHYDSQITAALLKGAWADSSGGTTPNGSELSWGEVVRKWGKHTGGSEYCPIVAGDLCHVSSTHRKGQMRSG
jgi:hypothetical protein